MKHSLARKIAILAAAASASGCAQLRNAAYEPHPAPAPRQPVAVEAKAVLTSAPASSGSLWTTGGYQLFTDDKAYRAGDILLVKVVQRSTGSKDANTDTNRESSISASVKHFFGFEDKINRISGYTDLGVEPTDPAYAPIPLVQGQTTNSFSGTGTTGRNDALTATVSCVVSDVLPNGNLVVYGRQTVTLNNEASVLTVQGIVRPTDIARDNTIDSQRIANADIRFTGSGAITDKQHPGWGTRIADWVMPF